MNSKLAFLLICVWTAVGQTPVAPPTSYNTDGITPPAMAPGTPAGSYALNGLDSVNLFNRKGNISIPITELRTRGGAGYTMRLNLDRPWRVRTYADCSSGASCSFYHTPLPDWWAGQEVEYGPGMVAGRVTDQMISCNGGSTSQTVLTRLTFIDSNLTENTLVDSPTFGRPVEVTGTNNGICTSLGQPPARGPRFESIDGQAMTFVASAAITEGARVNPGQTDSRPTIFPSGNLYHADGTRFTVLNGMINKIQDRNGNIITITDVNSGGEVGIDVNEANRTVRVRKLANCDVSDPQYGARCDKIMLGTGPNDPVVRIYWQLLSDTGVTPKTNIELFTGTGLSLDPFPPPQTFNPLVATKMLLPNGQSYTFQYNAIGDVTKLTLPTGGYFRYERTTRASGTDSPILLQVVDAREEYDSSNRFRRRTEYTNDGTGTNFGTLVKDYSNFSRQNYDPTQKRLVQASRTVYPTNPYATRVNYYYPDWLDGKESRNDTLSLALFSGGYNPDSIPNQSILKQTSRVWDLGSQAAPSMTIGSFNYRSGATLNPREKARTEKFNGLTKSSTIDMVYDNFNNMTSETVRGFDGTVLRVVNRSFENWTAYTNEPVHIRRQQYWETISNASGIESQTWLIYDDYTPSSALGHDLRQVAAPGANMFEDRQIGQKGNLMRVRRLSVEKNIWIDAEAQYDILGNVVKTWQPKDSGESFERSTTFEFSSACNYTYPSSITDALGRVTNFVYDCRTGQVKSFRDVNGKETTYSYNDPLDRIKSVTSPDGLGTTTFDYVDTPGSLKVTTSKPQNSCGVGGNIVSETLFDGFGRVSALRRYDGQGAIESRREYDGLGRAFWVSDPFRGAVEGNGVEMEWDGMGRPVSVRTTADGSTTRMGYQLDEKWTRDAQGKWRKETMDALGRTTAVTEDPSAQLTGPIPGYENTGTGLETIYVYDARGNLRTVTQGAQTRDFRYDSLGRLLTATNPEMTGAVSYDYWDNGSLKKKTSPGGVTQTLTYDRLNRVETKTYAGSVVATNSVTYCYDGNTAGNCVGAPTGVNLLGRLTMTVSGDYRTRMSAYDGLGRVTQSSQQFGTDAELTFGYQWNLAGGLEELRYPSGKRVKTCYDAAGQAVEVKNAVSGAAWASQGQYEVNGGLKQLTLGNGALETREYNTRWQARTVKVTQGQTSLLELQYRYCADEAEACAVNNGNVASQRVVHAGLNALTKYEYDSLNRLKTATDSGNQYQQVFDYDRYGNRALTAGWNPYGNMAAGALSAYDGGKNQVIALAETVNGTSYTAFQYDARGNLLTQVGGRAYTYDAENRMVEAKAAGVTQGIYKYDGDGRRVEAVAGGKTTRYVYDAFGSLAAEYEVGSGGGGVETTYLTQDALGSTRLAMRGDGSLRRYEYAPFGEAIESGAFGRGAEYGDGAGRKVTQRFTGKERDQETGLDYSLFRLFGSTMGRWTTPDPFGGIASDPQKLNRYAYVRNNPLLYIDPLGLDDIPVVCSTGTQIGSCQPGSSNCTFSGACPTPLPTQPTRSLPLEGRTVPGSVTPSGQGPSKVPSTPSNSGDVEAGWMAQQVFQGNRALWNNTAAAVNSSALATLAVASLPAAAATGIATTNYAAGVAAKGVGYYYAFTGASGAVVLGRYPDYINAARSIGANVYNIPNWIYRGLDYFGQAWTANQAFLNGSIIRGQQFYLSNAPLGQSGSYFAMELEYLNARGVGPDQWLMVPLPF